MKNMKLRKWACILVCTLIISMGVSNVCATGLDDKIQGVCVDAHHLDKCDIVNNTTNQDKNCTANQTNNKTVNKTMNYSISECDNIRSQLLKDLPINKWYEHSNPITNKDGYLYFSRLHCLICNEKIESAEAIGAIECWLLQHKDILGPDWKFSKRNIYDLVKPITYYTDVSILNAWVCGEFEYFQHSEVRKFRNERELINKFFDDTYTYNCGIFKTGSPLTEGTGYYHKRLIFNSYGGENLRRVVCQVMDWFMVNGVNDEMFQVEKIRGLVISCLDEWTRKYMWNYKFGWTAEND